MPQVRKLAPEEVQALENKGKGQRKLIEEQYDAILSEYNASDYGEATLDDEDNRLTVRNRLKAAAHRRNLDVAFRRTTGDLLRFQIIEQSNNGASKRSRKAAPPEPPPAPAKRKGGRPKKTG
jgi:hypothetical protein